MQCLDKGATISGGVVRTESLVEKEGTQTTPAKKRTRLEHRLLQQIGKASNEFQLIEPDDKVMVCVSGGKDSMAMLRLLQLIQRKAPFDFELIAVNLDQKQPGFPAHVLPEWFASQGVEYRILEQDTYSIVIDKVPVGKTYCSLCSRLRRGILYNAAEELGCTKIALGHHRDDIIETLLLNLFFSGQTKTMPPRLHSQDGRNIVIRPLAFCTEADLAEYATEMSFPIIPCDLCGSQENLQRKKIKRLIAQLASENDKIPGNIFAATRKIVPSHMLDLELISELGSTS